jgi:uncharacterized membrane protein YfhO
VVVSQNLAAGWTARVDGKPAPLVAVDGALMGVFVPAGEHAVALDYLPHSFLAGSVITAASFLAMAAAVGLQGRRRARTGRWRSGS